MDRAIGTAAREIEYSYVCPSQQKVLKYFLNGKDTFVSLPTGTGKLLCYCILSLVFDKIRNTSCSSIAVTVSALIALIKDQVNAMSNRKQHAVYIGSVKRIVKFQLIFTSPESLLTNLNWRDMLQSPIFQEDLVAFVVDEAHRVKKW